MQKDACNERENGQHQLGVAEHALASALRMLHGREPRDFRGVHIRGFLVRCCYISTHTYRLPAHGTLILMRIMPSRNPQPAPSLRRTHGKERPSPGQRLRALHDALGVAYGPQSWWPAKAPFEVIVGAYLTQ